jgi:hypothetical protein
MISLTCFGNAALRGIPIGKFFPNHSSCKFCESVTFTAGRKKRNGSIESFNFADSPDQWFENLIKRKIRTLRLHWQPRENPPLPDHISAGFVGGGRVWKIEAVRKDGSSEFWLEKWVIGNREDADRRIWRVTYGLREVAKTQAVQDVSLDAVIQNLRKALKEIKDASALYANGAFVELFDRGLNALDNPSADAPRGNLSPPGVLPSEAEALLKAAQYAWVFGGMGSWNDGGFPKGLEVEYERVSTQLYDALNEAIAKAVSSSEIIEMEMS